MTKHIQNNNLGKLKNIARIQSHENGNILGQKKPQMQNHDSNSEKSDNLEQIMNSDGEAGGDDEDAGENPFSKNNRRKVADHSPDRAN